MSEQVHLCPSCGQPVDLDNYQMKQVGATTEINSMGHSYARPVYRMAHYTCPAVHIAAKVTPKPRKTAAEIAREFDELCDSYGKSEPPAVGR